MHKITRNSLIIFFFAHVFFGSYLYATPKEIILIRHADKLHQANHGIALSAEGYIRAVKFGLYFLEKFGKPDVLFATNPDEAGLYTKAFREIQTLAPLVSMMEKKYPEHYYSIDHPYTATQYALLAKYLLTNPAFNNKRILICWDHYNIPFLLKDLGIKDKIPKWPEDEYDSVYLLQYGQSKLSYYLLHNQYPMKSKITWPEINHLFP